MEIIVVSAVLLLTCVFLTWISGWSAAHGARRHRLRLPPGPKGWPLLGMLSYVREGLHTAFSKMSQEYGPIMYMHLGSLPAVVISSRELAKEVLQTNEHCFVSRPAFIASSYLTYGCLDISFAPYGPHWRHVRKIATSNLLTPSKLRHCMGTMKDEVLKTVHLMLERTEAGGKNDGIVDVSTLLSGMAMNIVTQMMWKRRHRNLVGSESHLDQEFNRVAEEISEMAGGNNIADFLPVFLRPLTMKLSGLEKRMKDVHVRLDEFLETILRDHEKEQDLSRKDESVAPDGDDFVAVLLKIMNQSESSLSLSRDTMKAILTDVLVGGTDSSSTLADWTLAALLKHPQVMKKAQDELTRIVGEHRLVTESDIPNLEYLSAVLKEILRHWAVGLNFRFADGACKVGGYDIPVHSLVLINTFAIHHNSAVWERPWEFNPDRFLHSEMSFNGQNSNFDFLPFGSGRRICPGMNFADALVPLTLAQFLHCVRWSLPEGQGPDSVDMSDILGLARCRAKPLFAITKPRSSP